MKAPRRRVLIELLERMHGQRDGMREVARLNPKDRDAQLRSETATALLTPLIRDLYDLIPSDPPTTVLGTRTGTPPGVVDAWPSTW